MYQSPADAEQDECKGCHIRRIIVRSLKPKDKVDTGELGRTQI